MQHKKNTDPGANYQQQPKRETPQERERDDVADFSHSSMHPSAAFCFALEERERERKDAIRSQSARSLACNLIRFLCVYIYVAAEVARGAPVCF